MSGWAGLNKRQQHYMQAIHESDLELDADRRRGWKRFGAPGPLYDWRWMEYGVFGGESTPLYARFSQRNLIDRWTHSTFKALEARGLITCMETRIRRNGKRTATPFLVLKMTEEGRSLARSATGIKSYQPGGPGTLREEYWEAMGLAWQSRPAGVKDENGYYSYINWGTWRRLRDYKAGALVEEYSTGGPELADVDYWIRLTSFGEQFYRENWPYYHKLYPEVDAPDPGEQG